MNINYKKVIDLRKKLHQIAELSGSEHQTNLFLNEHLTHFQPDKFIEKIGGYGLAAVFSGKEPGPRTLFRADIDALPIEEINNFEYRSITSNVAHLCGHDGHSAILLGLAQALHRFPPLKGEVVLLFQPAEEIGKGAHQVIQDILFHTIYPDYAFALHNLPGFKNGAVVMRDKVFASASVGLQILMKGRHAHASQPETGLSPAKALIELMKEMIAYDEGLNKDEKYALLTITHVRLGDQAFGTAPGEALLQATLRSFDDMKLDDMRHYWSLRSAEVCKNYHLELTLSWHEYFPATVNDISATAFVSNAASKLGMHIISPDHPFRWSEDFGHFASVAPCCLFGLGAGIDHPNLHNSDYDFPDSLIQPGIELFENVIRQING
ncbi:MAG: amidohydrolase [Bacteroidetes bacterium HGW-Bacteroidetes-1]|jgi:amidohydrolase|nr:MAG: amidohydrolase [Bacteroidetes bacterium HGW-Bacteroidetes-1]